MDIPQNTHAMRKKPDTKVYYCMICLYKISKQIYRGKKRSVVAWGWKWKQG